jgi:phenylacetate-CoA ligase
MRRISRIANTARLAARSLFDRRVAYWPPEKIQRRQNRRVQSIVRHAYNTVPYYRAIMDELRISPDNIRTAADLAYLPIISDHDLRRDPARFTSSTADETGALRMFTTGSSGVPKTLLIDREAGLSRLVITARDRAVLARLLGKNWRQNQLFLISPASNSFKTMHHWDRNLVRRRTLGRSETFSVDAPLDAVIDAINRLQPEIVYSYGAYADEFFRYLADRKPRISLPKVWMYGGDAMSRQARTLAEEEFGCIIYSGYNSVETGRLGFECERRRGFHLNVDYCAVRLVDESGRNVPPGSSGEIIISNLYNRATVLLNYRLGDIGVLATESCPCGRTLPLLAQLTGKKMEVIRLANGNQYMREGVEVRFEQELACVLQCQLCQASPSSVFWRIVPASAADRIALERGLIAKSHATFGDGIDVRVEFVEKIDRGPGGKLRRVAQA